MFRQLLLTTTCSLCLLNQFTFAPTRAAEGRDESGILFREGFDDAQLLNRGWSDGDRFKISAKDPYRGSGCIEFRWKEGGTKPVSSSGIRRLFQPTGQVYIRYYIKLSRGWGWTNRSYHPHLTHFMTTENGKYHGPAASHLTLYIEPVNGKLRLAATDIQNKDAPHGLTQGPLRGGYNGRFYDSKERLFDDAKWHCVEAMFKLNSLDTRNDKPNADGEVRGWFDGKLVVERTDVVFRSTDFPKMKFNQFLLMPYFGPRLLPHAQTLWIDELAVGTRRIGAAGASENAPDEETNGRRSSARKNQPDATAGEKRRLGNWPQFRGPNRDNISPDSGLLKRWPLRGARLLWENHRVGQRLLLGRGQTAQDSQGACLLTVRSRNTTLTRTTETRQTITTMKLPPVTHDRVLASATVPPGFPGLQVIRLRLNCAE